MKTRMTELLGIRYPIMQGGMQHLATPVLAAAVSEAGGLGTINAATFSEEKDFREAIQAVRERTQRPFCVNFSLIPEVKHTTYEHQLQIAADLGVPVIETAGSNPVDLVPLIKERGFRWIHKVPTVRHALKAQELGADAVTIVGYEVGGHPGSDEVGLNVLLRHAVKALRIPVLAAGGYVDGAGLASALAMGADGIVMGTRFVATAECECHENFKKWILQAGEADTRIIQRSIHNPMRVANNAAAMRCLELERQGATLEELMQVISGKRSKQCYISGETEGGLFPVGQAVGLIDQIPTVPQLMEEIMRDAQERIRQLSHDLDV